MSNFFLSFEDIFSKNQNRSEFAKHVKNTEKIIVLVGPANSGKEAYAKYWFGIDLLANNRTDTYNQVYTLKDNNTILIPLNLSDSASTNNFNDIFVKEWVKKSKKVKIIVCVSTYDLFGSYIYFEKLQNQLRFHLPKVVTNKYWFICHL
jgi:hypothetical protein